MNMTSPHFIPAPPETVWTALNDPDVLRRLIDSTAKKLAGEFFDNFSQIVSANGSENGD